MRAWICEKWGRPHDLVLGTLPDPTCPPGHIVIDVDAWGVNFADLILIAGRYQARPDFPFAPGMEVAGRVSAVCEGEKLFAATDRVAAYVEYGGYADKVAVPASNVARLPDAVSMETGAAFPVPYGTARLALDRAGLAAGETVFVGGAGGSVGLATVELAHLQGARVIACVGDDHKRTLALDRGAATTVSSRSGTLREDLRAASPGGVDVAFDPVGGAVFDAAFRTLAYGGRIVTLGYASGEVPTIAANHVLVRHLSLIGSSFGLTCHRDPERVSSMWPPLVHLLEEKKIRPHIGATLGFDELPRALGLLENRSVGGRVVLTR